MTKCVCLPYHKFKILVNKDNKIYNVRNGSVIGYYSKNDNIIHHVNCFNLFFNHLNSHQYITCDYCFSLKKTLEKRLQSLYDGNIIPNEYHSSATLMKIINDKI